MDGGGHVVTLDAGFHLSHSIEKIEKLLVWASTNSLLNNYCAKENDLLNENKNQGKKRKIQTLL